MPRGKETHFRGMKCSVDDPVVMHVDPGRFDFFKVHGAK